MFVLGSYTPFKTAPFLGAGKPTLAAIALAGITRTGTLSAYVPSDSSKLITARLPLWSRCITDMNCPSLYALPELLTLSHHLACTGLLSRIIGLTSGLPLVSIVTSGSTNWVVVLGELLNIWRAVFMD